MTTSLAKSLELRKRINAKRPRFVRQDAFRFPKLKNKDHWRRPQGRHSKIRAKKKGQATLVRWGYGSPADARGLFSGGYVPARVFRPEDLTQLDPKKHIAIIGGSVGQKKRATLAVIAQQKGIKVYNIQVSSYQENVKKEMGERRNTRKTLIARREKKQKEEKTEKKRTAQKQEEKEKSVDKGIVSEKANEQAAEEKEQKRRETEKVIIHK